MNLSQAAMLRFESELDVAPRVASQREPHDTPTREDAWFSWAPVAVPLFAALVLATAFTVWALVL
jgi:glycerol uptake facilitator-like aquaporin